MSFVLFYLFIIEGSEAVNKSFKRYIYIPRIVQNVLELGIELNWN